MAVRTVQTPFTSSVVSIPTSSMIVTPNVLGSVDLNTAYPPGLAPDSFRSLEKGLAGRSHPYVSATARNTSSAQVNGSLNWNSNNSRSSSRSTNKRYPQGMRLPSTSYLQTQNQHRRTNFSSSPKAQGLLGAPRKSRFDPFADEPPLYPSPEIISTRSSNASEPLYTHYYYYDHSTNRPTLAYADDKNPVNTITASTNILLDTLLNGGLGEISRSPSPPRTIASPSPTTQTPTKSRSPSPPHSPRPRAAAISRPGTSPSSVPTTPSVSPPLPPTPAPIKMSKVQRDAIARVVANMLLNRADGLGRRSRRCATGYVKSSLSRVVTVE
ncbi:hypothetical protein BDP27DRAFT_1413971 [Rhodocollybia butyracea]|uniref:Uncharacterized protein n=1 Tax=Rhodocollybia butyracea TaxID=206335 RepID=A0A9P5Q7V7_9AGAR|nr:hypothetical protein BDP27DRAFT_1413971 [Rhodocollybia butyracea]